MWMVTRSEATEMVGLEAMAVSGAKNRVMRVLAIRD